MGLRDQLKKREEKREAAKNGGNGNLPEGVTRYVRLGQELKDGKNFVILRDPDMWYFYYVHEDGDFATRATYVKKHTCLNSPRKAAESAEEFEKMFAQYAKPNGDVCISDKAKVKRVLYFMVPVYDIEHKEWRVLDLKEFHVNNLIGDIDKTEKAARKFDKSYTMIGDVVTISKADKTYTIEGADIEDDEAEAIKADASKIDQSEIVYEELANFRDEDDIIELLWQGDDGHVKKSVLPKQTDKQPDDSNSSDDSEPIDEGGEPIDIDKDDLPF